MLLRNEKIHTVPAALASTQFKPSLVLPGLSLSLPPL